MLSDLTREGGGTIIVPGSHRRNDHPRAGGPIAPLQPYPGERQLEGRAGSVAVMDACMWHAVAPNRTDRERVAVLVRYAPWWLNIAPLRSGTIDRQELSKSKTARTRRFHRFPGKYLRIFRRTPIRCCDTWSPGNSRAN